MEVCFYILLCYLILTCTLFSQKSLKMRYKTTVNLYPAVHTADADATQVQQPSRSVVVRGVYWVGDSLDESEQICVHPLTQPPSGLCRGVLRAVEHDAQCPHCLRKTVLHCTNSSCVLIVFMQMCKLHLSTSVKRVCYAVDIRLHRLKIYVIKPGFCRRSIVVRSGLTRGPPIFMGFPPPVATKRWRWSHCGRVRPLR